MRLVQEERDWGSLAKSSYTLLTLVIKLCIAAMQETENSFGFQVEADFHSRIHHLTKNCLQIETLLHNFLLYLSERKELRRLRKDSTSN